MLFEKLVVRDLCVYAQAVDAQVFAYRDETGLEADAIVETTDGRWAAFQVKLGQREIDAAAESLVRLRERVDTQAAGDPIALVVVTATGYGYRRSSTIPTHPEAGPAVSPVP